MLNIHNNKENILAPYKINNGEKFNFLRTKIEIDCGKYEMGEYKPVFGKSTNIFLSDSKGVLNCSVIVL